MTTQQSKLVERVERRLEGLARQMLATFVGEIPIYSRLPQEQLSGEIATIVRENLRIFFRCVREDRVPTDAELAEPRASAARRAEERVPLESVLTAYHMGGRIGWQAIAEEARTEEFGELVQIGHRVLTYIQSVTSAVAAAYLEEQQLIYGEERDTRRALVEALLAPHPIDSARLDTLQALARRAGIRLAQGYLVLAVRIGPSPDERDAGVTGAVAGRRKVRRIQAQLDAMAGEPVLMLLDADGGFVLFPIAPPDADRALRAGSELAEALGKAAEADVLAGAAWRPAPEGVAAAGAEAREVLRLAGKLGRPAGAYVLDDVLLEHALTDSRETARRLLRILDPLGAKPDLIETLERWYEASFDRRSAAAALNVHPNTLDYRLRRIAELTGLDLTSARGIQLLGAALTARRFVDVIA